MITLPQKPEIVKKEGNKAYFEIEALYPGYGVTVGNALRRVLISSLEGAAVTQAKIKNAPHEFSTIQGIAEDIITIILNLKQLRFKVFGEISQRATLKVKGLKEATGDDFELPAQLELVNPDCHIAALTSKTAELEIEILVEKGAGYLSRENRKKQAEMGVGVIPVDAIFSPMKRVGFKTENMRVGDRTDFDKLFLEIETDGIISPQDAFSKAAEILVGQFSFLANAFEKEETVQAQETKKRKKSSPQKHAQKKKRKKI